jgi:hypothetical protein
VSSPRPVGAAVPEAVRARQANALRASPSSRQGQRTRAPQGSVRTAITLEQ